MAEGSEDETSVPAPVSEDRSASTAESPQAPRRDVEALAAAVASEPAPEPEDEALEALDAVLSDGSDDPISGVSQTEVEPEQDAEPEGTPGSQDVQASFASVAPRVRACVAGQGGRVVTIRAVFASSGRVTAAVVEASSVGVSPRERSCIARAVRGAQLPPFEESRFEVTFPLRL
jgi:hypothetical protein